MILFPRQLLAIKGENHDLRTKHTAIPMQGNQFLKKQSVKFEKEEKRNDKAWKDFTPKKRKRK